MINRLKTSENQIMVGSFLLVLGTMLWTVQTYGVSVPFYDEWEAEAGWLYRLYEQGTLGLGELLAAHNGHRILLTRLTALFLYIANGGWDPQLQMILNAFLHALITVVMVKTVCLRHQGPTLVAPLILTLCLMAVPFSWLSILVAFQTQFYFMVLFSVLSLNYFSSARYIAGYVFGLLAMMAMTAGAFVFAAFVGMTIVEVVQSRKASREQVFHSTISTILFIVFVYFLPDEPATQAYYAQHLRGFVITLLATISWPFRVSYGVGLIVYIPAVIYVFRALFLERTSNYMMSLAVFMALQILAMAYFRGGEGVPPANRYWELMILGIWLNGMCAADIANRVNTRLAKSAVLLWVTILIIGMGSIGYQSFADGLPNRKAESMTAQTLIRQYLETGETNVFEQRTTFEVSHLNTKALVNLLNDETVRSVLPATLNTANKDRLLFVKLSLFFLSPFAFLAGLTLVVYALRRKKQMT